MNNINILDSFIFNRIAAGEVVESPASVVKELVENSIDASCRNIVIEIKDGGTSFIRVSDDGTGISKEDLPKALLPHATSKIKNLNDLDNIGTLGFRGEALPSIASVAKLTILSRKQENETGRMIVCENNKQLLDIETGALTGTQVTVENLFHNVPARKKFLKKNSLEGAKITDLVQKLILANYNISIKYIVDEKIVFHSTGDGMKSAIYSVYNKNLEDLVEINSTMSDIVLKGYVSKPAFSKHSRNFQTIVVNGRVVENNDISYYVYLCYQNYLMSRQFPMFILYINLPFDMVDVNVHPNKLDVKFSDMNSIKHIIMKTIKETVEQQVLFSKIITQDNNKKRLNNFDNTQPLFHIPYTETAATQDKPLKVTSESLDINISKPENDYIAKNRRQLFNQPLKLEETRSSISNNNPQSVFILNSKLNDSEMKQDDLYVDEVIIIGKIFNTYILVQQSHEVYFIDQHAAHEKIIYDKLINDIEQKSILLQDLLIPFVFEVNNTEKVLIEENLTQLEKSGFIISQFGGTKFSISAIPSSCTEINLKIFVSILLEKLKSNSIKKSDFIKNSVAQSACKASVKGTMDLNKQEINELLDEMKKNQSAVFCPHGRPTVIKITKQEIEKWFKRIV